MKSNIVLPIAGLGERFVEKGYVLPKPMIDVKGQYLVEKSLESVNAEDSQLIFIVRKEHEDDFAIKSKLVEKFGKDIKVIEVDYTTPGAICTCLLAAEYIDNDVPLIIFTPDCYFEPQFDLERIDITYDGVVCTFESNSDAHSYVVLDENNFVLKAAEKEVISSHAVGGLYYFKKGSYFVKYANELVERNVKSRGEYYICPVYNLLINDGMKIGIDPNSKHIVLGTPKDLESYIGKIHEQ